jgi:hypothetical protein
MADYRAGADVNWPVVGGVAIVAVVACYVLYSVNNLLQNVETVTVTPLAQLESGIGSFLSAINPGNWFSSNNAVSGN